VPVLLASKYRPQAARTLAFVTVSVATSSIWFLIDYLQNGPTFVMENLAYQVRLLTTGDAGHEQPFWYHPVVVLIGCFPASMLLFGGLRSSASESLQQRTMRIWMIVLMGVVLVVFSIVKTKIIHYSSMTYLPLTFLAAIFLHRWMAGTVRWRWWHTASTIGMAAVWSVLGFVALWAFANSAWLMSLPTFRDPFLREALQRKVTWLGFEPYLGLLIVTGALLAWYVRRSGRHVASVVVLFGSVLVFVETLLPIIAPRIEPYTQGAALDFYEELQGKNTYVQPLSMKSYAHLFYTRKTPELSASARGLTQDAWQPWLLEGKLDRPAYFVCRIQDAGQWRNHPNLREIRAEGGFVMFERIQP
jgi:hypothetical protein